MAAFVFDYDHNAPNVEHLKNTHQRMFQRIRRQCPLLPIIMLSRPQPRMTPEEYQRRSIIMETYQNALAAGDEHVYFIDGSVILGQFGGDSGTVDGCHPNDLGFMCMARSVGAVLEEIW